MMKREANRFLVPALLSIATIVVAFNAWLAFRAVNSLLESEHWVEHTWQVIYQVELIMSSAKDAETGNRGYLITGDDAYLEPYNSATRELPIEIDQFAFLTSDNPRQQARVPEMRAVMQRRLALLKDGIDLRRNGSQDTIRLLVLSGTGKAEMDQMRHIADGMEAEERRLLVQRTAGAQSAGVRARFTVALASALDFLLIILIFRYFSQERRLRFAAEIARERLAIARAEAESRAEEVHMLNETLEQRIKLRTSELEATNRELEAFSYSVSHDLRAPLRTVDGFSVALEEDYASAVDQVGRDYILRIRNGVQRMGAVIDALLQLSRVTRSELTREPFDMSLLVESVAAVLREENPDREITFNIEPGLRAEGDPRLLRIALENLLGNAVKFSARTLRTVVDFGWDGGKNAWFVQDYGAGFDMSYASKLFSAFNRLHGDKDFQGSGIGLATVARVIRRHYGEIWAESKIDHGATFWFTLG